MIDQINKLLSKYSQLSTRANPSIDELKEAIDEIKKTTSSKEFKEGVQVGTIDLDSAGKIKRLQDSIKERIDEFEYKDKSSSSEAAPKNSSSKSNSENSESYHQHDSAANKIMNDADDLYWKGKWKEAYDLYLQVLKLEPGWPRAEEYAQKAKYNYDNKVGIPKIAIPDTVKIPFARAESALSRWEVENAKTFVDNAYKESSKLGLGKWDELEDLKFRVENFLDIHKSYLLALSLSEDQIDEAIEKIDAAYEQSRRPLYATKLEEFKEKKIQKIFEESEKLFKLGKTEEAITKCNEVLNQHPQNIRFSDALAEYVKYKETLQEIGRYLEGPKIVFGQFLEIENRLKLLQNILAKYPDSAKNHTLLKELKGRFEAQKPLVLSDLKSNITTLERRYESATKVEDAESAHHEVNELLDLLAHIGADANDVKRFSDRRDNRQIELEAYSNDLKSLVQQVTNKKKFLTKEDADRANEILERFPNDLGAKRFQKPLGEYQIRRNLFTYGIAALVVLVLGVIAFVSINAWSDYVISLTPTATMTLTPTPTLTSTPTSTPTQTPIPSSTPLPPKLRVTRDLNAKSGCYEDYRAVGEIRVGSVVNLLQSDRKFDNVGRECVLVEFENENESIVGWVLLVDLSGATP